MSERRYFPGTLVVDAEYGQFVEEIEGQQVHANFFAIDFGAADGTIAVRFAPLLDAVTAVGVAESAKRTRRTDEWARGRATCRLNTLGTGILNLAS